MEPVVLKTQVNDSADTYYLSGRGIVVEAGNTDSIPILAGLFHPSRRSQF